MKSIILATVFATVSFNAMALDLSKSMPSQNVEIAASVDDDKGNVAPQSNVAPVAKAKRVTIPMTSDQIAAIAAFIKPVCDKQSVIKLSKDAIAACNNDEKKLPKLTKKGDKLTKGKTGAEFSTLLANLDAFN